MGAFLRRLIALFRRGGLNRDLDDELAFHVAMRQEGQRHQGVTAADAELSARRQFGSVLRVKEHTRDAWRFAWLDRLLQDIRGAFRMIRCAPGLSVIAVGSSAVGVGACSVIFAILSFALYPHLPVDQPGHLVSVTAVDQRSGQAVGQLSYPDYLDLTTARAFEGVAAVDPLVPVAIEVQGDPQRHWGALVTANYFAVVRPAFALGRGFDTARDDRPGEPPVVVLSHALWQRRLGGDPDVVGRPILINQRPSTVIGVTSANFRGTDAGLVPDFWIPFSMLDEQRAFQGIARRVLENRERYWLSVVGRLNHVDVRAAAAELNVLAPQLNALPRREDDRRFVLERAGQLDPNLRTMAVALFSVAFGITGMVLLVSCSNVASLLLGRAAARRREIAVRMALGAGRIRLLQQLLTESLVLALAGGVGGWLLATYLSSLFGLIRVPLGWPLDLSISADYRLVLFCASLSLLTGVAFGLVPALHATRPDLVASLKADRQGGILGRIRLRDALVVTQVAICTLLLLGTGLFLRSLQAARAADFGIAHRNLLLLSFDPSLGGRSDTQATNAMRSVLDSVRRVPGVESATLTSAVPLTLIISNSNFVAAEQAKDRQARRVQTDIYAIGPDFFSTLGIRMLAGEVFADGPTSRAVVNDTFERLVFPGGSAVGRRVVGDGKALDIVGVVATAKSRSIGEAPRPAIYLPVLTAYTARELPRGVSLMVKTNGAPMGFVGPVRDAIRSAEPSIAVFDVQSMDSHVESALIAPRLAWTLSAAAGVLGLTLAVIGIYGVVSFAVARRRRELGVRLALGARSEEVLAMILRQGLGMTAIGVALGCLSAFGLSRFTASLLYGVGPLDPLTFTAVPAFLIAVAALASLLPARQAARLDPAEVLRSE